MELTEEHHKWIAESTPTEGTSSAEKAHWILGAEEAIQKFGGIQWNKYPETKPTEDGYYLVVDFCGRLVQWTWLGVSTGMEWQDVTHWAEINLPNQ